MPIVELDSIAQVALRFMNEDHREEGRLLNELGDSIVAFRANRASAPDVLARFGALDRHTKEHFTREEAAMQHAGFPPYPVHKAEHDHVLAEMAEEGRRFRDSADAERLWVYVSQAIPAWFAGHIESMDYITARFIATRDAVDAARSARRTGS